jgi:uncharacterized protein (TIGR03118 family)
MNRSLVSKGILFTALVVAPFATVRGEDFSTQADVSANSTGRSSAYEARVLVSNGPIDADFTDRNLINAWGVAFNPNGFVWVANSGSGTSTLYDGTGKPNSLVVTIPAAKNEEVGSPTGIVFNSSNDFAVTQNDTTGPSRFIFATQGGLIAGWAPTVNGTRAIVAVDNAKEGALYRGLALSGNGAVHLLYAADFNNERIDVFGPDFKPFDTPGDFVDKHLPAGYVPFNIQAINGDLYVLYVRRSSANPVFPEFGRGLGIVNVFDPNGKFVRRVTSGGPLNAPWGIALAPANFGRFGGALLVGNFGDGTIHAFAPVTGAFLGTLTDKNGKRIRFEGLWGLAFGNGLLDQEVDELFFAAGPAMLTQGIYGVIRAHH